MADPRWTEDTAELVHDAIANRSVYWHDEESDDDGWLLQHDSFREAAHDILKTLADAGVLICADGEPTEHERMAAATASAMGAVAGLDRGRGRIAERLAQEVGDNFTFDLGYRKGLRSAITEIEKQMREEA